jgi:hypothetical protein
MIIEIDDNLIDTLNNLAQQNNLSAEEYAAGIIRTFLESQYVGGIVEKIRKIPISNLHLINKSIDNFIIKK